MHTLHIKHMVCQRCIRAVAGVFRDLGWPVTSVQLGQVILEQEPDDHTLAEMRNALEDLGFELIDDRRSRLISQTKAAIISLVHDHNGELRQNLSDYLSGLLHIDYGYLSSLFSEVEGTTIEKYFIAQKIERVKEWLVYDEKTLSEIAFELQYSSVAHLSSQFKKVTGLTPSYFRQLGAKKRTPLDQV